MIEITKRKRILIISIVIVAILGISAAIVSIENPYFWLILQAKIEYPHRTYMSDFDKYYKDFNAIKEVVIKNQNELEKTGSNALIVDYNQRFCLYNAANGNEIPLSMAEQQKSAAPAALLKAGRIVIWSVSYRRSGQWPGIRPKTRCPRPGPPKWRWLPDRPPAKNGRY